MTRSGYSSDCEYLELYRANVDRSLRSKRGQAFLRELATVMDAMKVKELIAWDLVDVNGNCCAIGAVCLSRGIDTTTVDPDCPQSVGKLVGISRVMTAEIEFMNDEEGSARETPAERWQRIRKWVAEQIIVTT